MRKRQRANVAECHPDRPLTHSLFDDSTWTAAHICSCVAIQSFTMGAPPLPTPPSTHGALALARGTAARTTFFASVAAAN